MTQYYVGFITAPSGAESKEIARKVINHKLAACVNIIPGVRSVYRWKGKVEEAGESLLVLKTKKSLAKKLIQYVKRIHPYSVPEVIFLPIETGYKPYLNWISKEAK